MTAESKKIVVLISGSGSNLQALIDKQQAGQISGQLVAVISNKQNAFGLTRAEKASIATHVVDHTQYSSRSEYDQALANVIDTYQPDLVVLAGFMRILTPEFVQKYVGKMLNIHPSLLPKYQGLNTHQRAIDAKDETHGVSVHFVTEELDGGPVVCQAEIPILPDDTAETLAERIHTKEHIIYPLVVEWFCQNKLVMKANQAYFDNQVLPSTGVPYVEKS
ncbi:phosphoribosylglycinamide formyltransferase [Catenovulum sp. 2E275]|uniref:phosphoribosylglycinamide formyltransferase n=1 Tax=Catenovulum sp. 2E275 TaxID=2980497 RepID=UPI0021D13F2C|nr:phosphoribosylglycinamide formyltransferase [Catenovulum sp. 2E275]MCU4674692.1 phosphoribosylglycinamide formyltransferase [Catenovulum sp. 2E275]